MGEDLPGQGDASPSCQKETGFQDHQFWQCPGKSFAYTAPTNPWPDLDLDVSRWLCLVCF